MFQKIERKYPRQYGYFRVVAVVAASFVYALNLRCFAKNAGLLPGGFSGVTLLLQNIGETFFSVSIPYTFVNMLLNLFPIYLGFRYIGKKFTWLSILSIGLSSVFFDMLPVYVFTEDILLISIFGGIISGFAVSLCLNVGATTGGTDLISIFLAEQKGVDAWNYIFMGNVMMLVIAGALFGWEIALYSIIYQFCGTQVIQMLYKRYKKETMFIISNHPTEIYNLIREHTNHDATVFQGIGCYEGKEKILIYSVINTEEKRILIPLIRKSDDKAFINIIKTEELNGLFHKRPND